MASWFVGLEGIEADKDANNDVEEEDDFEEGGDIVSDLVFEGFIEVDAD